MIKLIRKGLFCLLLACLLGASTLMTDPTRPPGTVLTPAGAASQGSLTVNAIFIYPNYRSAIINGQIVMIGDHLGDYTITSITPFAVELSGPQNSQEVLPLVTPVKQERQ